MKSSLKSKPLVSVIIPAHNGAAYIQEAIQSVLSQTYPHVEIWVIDNGSTDKTKEAALAFSKVHYVTLEGVSNTAYARNEGISRANGSFLAFLDQDDLWLPDKLEKQLDHLEKSPGIGAAICYQKMVLEPGHTKPHWLKKEFLEKSQPAYLPSALLAKRALFDQTDLFNPDFSLTSDVAWFFKAKHSGIDVALLPETLLIRRIHSDNASHRYLQIQKELLSVIHTSLQDRKRKKTAPL